MALCALHTVYRNFVVENDLSLAVSWKVSSLFICLSPYLSTYLSTNLLSYLYSCLSDNLSPFLCVCVSLSIYISINFCLSICLFIHSSSSESIHLPTPLSLFLSESNCAHKGQIAVICCDRYTLVCGCKVTMLSRYTISNFSLSICTFIFIYLSASISLFPSPSH